MSCAPRVFGTRRRAKLLAQPLDLVNYFCNPIRGKVDETAANSRYPGKRLRAGMAEYKHPHFLKKFDDPVFDNLNPPGTTAPRSGLYRCQVCGHECVSTLDYPLPAQDHHAHSGLQPIQWRLIVASAHA
jgi:hypothetical protein